MRIDVVTLFPEMFRGFLDGSLLGAAQKAGLLDIRLRNIRDFATGVHRQVDDRPYGGGPGMLMKTEPLIATIKAAKAKLEHTGETACRTVYLSPQGKPLNQAKVVELAQLESMLLVCGRYQGIDARVIEAEIDEEVSLGDFVLSGGELAAMALLDAVIRQQPGALGDDDSAQLDSLANGLLHAPEYTRPQQFEGRAVPKVLLSGDHAAIARWREKQSLGATWLKRPDLLEQIELSQEQQELLEQFKAEYQAAK